MNASNIRGRATAKVMSVVRKARKLPVARLVATSCQLVGWHESRQAGSLSLRGKTSSNRREVPFRVKRQIVRPPHDLELRHRRQFRQARLAHFDPAPGPPIAAADAPD